LFSGDPHTINTVGSKQWLKKHSSVT
jgi:hypothetical protein